MIADVTQYFDYVLMAMLLAVGVAIIRLRNLFAIVMLTGVYSLLSAAWFTSLDALDVGFTEAAVGAGISTVLLLAAMLLTSRECDKVSASRHWAALAVCVAAGAALFYACRTCRLWRRRHARQCRGGHAVHGAHRRRSEQGPERRHRRSGLLSRLRHHGRGLRGVRRRRRRGAFDGPVWPPP
jgi:uncharacterized MnhB-related membrane protein